MRISDRIPWRVVLLAATLSGAPSLPFAFEREGAVATVSGRAEVVDGDGLRVGPVAIRIHGIDAPEAGQTCRAAEGGRWPCGVQAIAALDAMAGNRQVVCIALDRDRYGRIVARCTVDGADVAEALIRAGLAWAYREYSSDYVALEDPARESGHGIWQAPTEPAWEFRADRWGRAVAAAPDGCPIKGNIASGGERIYHTPWSSWYARTEIDLARGERWFCDEAEAVAAGWRAARGR
ncbi:thermonuclease family protein [Tropicimonas sp. IMCC34011]|uniref:thermonuclease family protein n=1 Tax=Tropicimonas sp. IMCC34011 TaxID=2248759 RepID=UPI000E27C3C7|nr:thermonuclease family protein [Tropicimonas sp. IMCC34011]